MNNEEGMNLKVGDEVWTIGVFESIYIPYCISTLPWKDGKNVFVKITERLSPENRPHEERMNVVYISKEHPRGWIFLVPGTSDYDKFTQLK